jgi:hypothetical protein
MAYPGTRSVNRELEAGATDGKYRKVIADRGGVVERDFVANRADLTNAFYGIHEAPTMEVPGCSRACSNPYAVSTPVPRPEYF